MIRILANDGIHPDGKLLLEEAGYEVVTDKILQEQLADRIQFFDVIIVRSATKIRQDIIDAGKERLQVICRAGVGLDNIDVEYAKSRGIRVFNTPGASSQSVAELVMGHALTIARFLHQSNQDLAGDNMKPLKKAYSKGMQLAGSTMGIIGFGRIGQFVARAALGMGMKVVVADPNVESVDLGLFPDHLGMSTSVTIETTYIDEVLRQADVLTLHVPFTGKPLMTKRQFELMKTGAIFIHAARGGVVDEDALLDALDSGKLMGAGLDVFINEPNIDERLLAHPKVSVSPHIGASTVSAQAMIGRELADIILGHFGELG